MDSRSNGFLDDFKRAQQNLERSQGRSGAYNAGIPGSQPLTVFPKLARGGNLTNSANIRYLQTGQVGQMAAQYTTDGNNGTVNFFPNPTALGADYLPNYTNSSYTALSGDVGSTLSARITATNGSGSAPPSSATAVIASAAGPLTPAPDHFQRPVPTGPPGPHWPHIPSPTPPPTPPYKGEGRRG